MLERNLKYDLLLYRNQQALNHTTSSTIHMFVCVYSHTHIHRFSYILLNTEINLKCNYVLFIEILIINRNRKLIDCMLPI